MKTLFLTLLLLVSAGGCQTSGGGNTGTGTGIVALFALSSSIAKASQSDPSAKTVWCQTFELVESTLLGKPTPGEPLTWPERSGLQNQIEPIAKQQGYRLHAIQINHLIDDAVAVWGNEEAKSAEQVRCSTAPQ